MRDPSLQITTLISLLVHITFLSIALITIKQADHFVGPTPYIVSLVSPEIEETDVSEKGVAAVGEDESAPQMSLPSETLKNHRIFEDTKQYISDRIVAIKAKKKVKDIVRLRNIISLKGSSSSKEEAAETVQHDEGEKEGGEWATTDQYTKAIGGEIWQHYEVIPEIKGKNLEAIISITVMKDGTIKINKIEKSSGNLLFDRAVLNAIRKASPVSPPPYEMEIGVRFRP